MNWGIFHKNSLLTLLWRGIVVLFLLALTLGVSSVALASDPGETGREVVIEISSGEVVYQPGGAEVERGGIPVLREWFPVKEGQALRPGDRIRTTEGSEVTLTSGDRQIRLGPDTELVVAGGPEGPLEKLLLKAGRIWAILKHGKEVEKLKRVEFVTVAAVGAVRGTEFSVSVEGTTTTLRVYQGAVDLSDLERKSTVVVSAGYQASVTKGLLPTSPVPIDETEAPRVVQVFPGPGVPEISEAKPTSIKFSKAIHPDSIIGSSIVVKDESGAPLEGSWTALADTVLFKPQQSVAAQKRYTVTVKGGLQGVKDWFRNPLPSDYTWSFTLEKPFLVARLDTSKEEKYLKEALDNVEKYRKSNTTLYLLDAATNRPIPGALITYQQKSRDFILGPMWLDMWRPEAERQPIKEIFTGGWTTLTAGMGVEWTTIEPAKGVFNFTPGDEAISRLEKEYPGTQWVFMFYDLTLNAYGGRPPPHAQFDGIADSRVFPEYLNSVYQFVYQLVSHYKGKIRYWITQNEINYPSIPMREFNLAKPPWTLDQAVEINRVTAKAIRDANPGAVILLGTVQPSAPTQPDTETRMDPWTFARLNLRKGVDFDAVSIQAYSFFYSPGWFYEYFKRFEELGKLVYIQETSFPSQPFPIEFPWWYGWKPFNQEVQADWYRYLITLAYGSKNVIGISPLNFHDVEYFEEQAAKGGAYNAFTYQGLLRKDQPKKSYYVYRDLVRSFTTKGSSLTDSNGKVAFKGFAGDYLINIALGGLSYGFTVHVGEGADNPLVFFRDGTQVTRSIQREAQILWDRVSQKIGEARPANFQGEQSKLLLKQAQNAYSLAQAALNSGRYEAAREQLLKAFRLVTLGFAAEGEYRAAIGFDLSQAEKWLNWSLAIGRQLDSAQMKGMLSQAKQAYEKGQHEMARTLAASILSKTVLKLDGSGASWEGIKPVAAKTETPVKTAGTSLKELYAVADQDYLYIMLKVWGEPNKDAAYGCNLDTGSGRFSYFIRADSQQARLREMGKDVWVAGTEIVNAWGQVIELRVPLKALGTPAVIRIHALSISSKQLAVQEGRSDQFDRAAAVVFPGAVPQPTSTPRPTPATRPTPLATPVPTTTPRPTPPTPRQTPSLRPPPLTPAATPTPIATPVPTPTPTTEATPSPSPVSSPAPVPTPAGRRGGFACAGPRPGPAGMPLGEIPYSAELTLLAFLLGGVLVMHFRSRR